MSEPKQQPKILLRKPKKSHRSPPDPSSSLSKGDGTGGARTVSTASSNSASPPPGPKQPLWYRFRTALTTLLILNAVVIGYTVFRTSSKPSDTSEENTATEKEEDEKKLKEETSTEKAKPIEEAAIEKERDEKKPIKAETEAATEKEKDEKKPIKAEIEKEKAENVHTRKVFPEPSKVPLAINLQEISKQKISSEEQQELFKWLLAEKRKLKPANKAEKAQIDAEKALLKEFLRGKRVLNV